MAIKSVAVIGTAGRDKDKTYDLELWCAMWEDARRRFVSNVELVSGGAAWADHIAVSLFLADPEQFKLRLYLPSVFAQHTYRFVGPASSSAAAANYYHERFTQQTGIDGRREIATAMTMPGCTVEMEPSAEGYGGMFARNSKVALASDACLAYTWGQGKEPADGGTKDTWDKITGRKVHVPLDRCLKNYVNFA